MEIPRQTETVGLKKTEQRSWVRFSKRKEERSLSVDDKETRNIFRKFLAILNKLTPQKFKDLAEQALELPLSSVERLKGCIDMLFEKAMNEPMYSVAYANLCRVMSPIKVTCKTEDGTDQSTSFRRELLTKCQREFEKDKKDVEEKEKMQKVLEDCETPELRQECQALLEVWETAARRRSLGNICFIGELFKLKMLSESIMHDCIVRLLRSSYDVESIECFCKLIIITGKDLDRPKGKQLMDKYFTRIEEIISKKRISLRIKFLLQDVQETRTNDWVARHRQEAPKTIDQIHCEAKQEQQEEQMMIKLSKDRRERSKSSGTSGQDEWRGKDESRRQEPQKVDVNRLPSFLRKEGGNRDNEVAALAHSSNMRPSGWNRKPIAQPSNREAQKEETTLAESNEGGDGDKR